ncbi:MAG: translation elongation factor Ts [Gammaproteobacteria bacterium TMED119]|nr:MAG: translation elongation factor Ts [Gammaproteobacteria bacterium TMED119]
MQITAAMVKELRERTGAGMMECKKALSESDGDMDAAIELMRKSGQAKADKKASRVAAEGTIVMVISDDKKQGVILEVNCETDFVGKDENFLKFSHAVAKIILEQAPADVDSLMAIESGGDTLEDTRQVLVSKIGENIQVRRFESISSNGMLGYYSHGSRIGVMVEMDNGTDELCKDIAMHIAASKPACVDESNVPAQLLQQEKDIFTAQAEDSGKPAEIIEKMVQGRLKKFLGEITLLGQPFVKDPDKSVEKLLAENAAKVISFQRYEVGEGIEKKSENFAEEVMAQVNQSS